MQLEINQAVAVCHKAASDSGWWTDLRTGERLPPNVPTKLMLVVSELSEAMEADRKNLMDSHLPERSGIEVELADAVIRIFDLAGRLDLDLGGAVVDKLAYNKARADHKIENRIKAEGKKY